MENFFSMQIAQHLRQVFFGGNWTCVNFKSTLEDVHLEQALVIGPNGHSIARLTYHIHYFVAAVLPVLQGKELTANDAFSFDCPDFKNDLEWRAFVDRVLADAEVCANGIEQCADGQLQETFVLAKYGNYCRNFLGLIEHSHYHLAQIIDLKKMCK